MHRRIHKTGLLVVALLVAVPAIVTFAVRTGGESALEAEAAKWEALGGLPTRNSSQVAASAERNAAILYKSAMERADVLALGYETDDEDRFFAVEICDDDELKDIVDLAWRASKRPEIDWKGAYPETWVGGMGGLARQRALARLLASAAECALEQDNAEQAGRALAAGLALGSAATADEPTILSALVTGSIHSMMLNAVHAGFRDLELPESNDLERALDAIDWDTMLRQCLLGEAAVGLAGFENQRPNPILGLASTLAGWSFDADMAYYLGTMRRALEQLELTADQRDWSFLSAPSPRTARMSEFILPSIDTAVSAIARGESRVLLAKEAIKLRRHRAQHGSYPDSWPMPTDPATGTPLHYERDGDGFLLWSEAEVGEFQEPIEWRWK